MGVAVHIFKMLRNEKRRLAMGSTREACGDGVVLYLDCGGD